MIIVHYLQYGQTLCNMPGTPNTWPENHKWVGPYQDTKDVTCEECKRIIKEKEKDSLGA